MGAADDLSVGKCYLDWVVGFLLRGAPCFKQ
jgi:hypothetical protein